MFAQQRHAALRVRTLSLDQPADHDDFAIVRENGALERSLVGDQVRESMPDTERAMSETSCSTSRRNVEPSLMYG